MKASAAFTLFFALAAHLYCWTNSLYSHDSLMLVQNDWQHQIGIGRFLQEPYVILRGEVVAPMLVGLLGLAFLTLSVIAVVIVMDFTKPVAIACTAALMTTNATVTLINATYLGWFDVMMASLLLSCAAVALTVKTRWGFVPGSVLVAASMGLYQGYIGMSLGLFLAWGISRLVAGERARGAVLIGCKMLASVVLGALLYSIAASAVRDAFGVAALDAYNSLLRAGGEGAPALAALLPEVYAHALAYFAFPETHLPRLAAAMNAAIFLCSVFLNIAHVVRNPIPVANAVLSMVFLVAFPLAVGCVYVLSGGMQHALMIYPYYCWYVLAFASLELPYVASRDLGGDASGRDAALRSDRRQRLLSSAPRLAIAIAVGVVAFLNIVYSNQVYVKKNLEYQGTQALMTRIVDRMEQADGYEPEVTPVLFVGDLGDNPVLKGVRSGFPPHTGQEPFDGPESPENFTDYATGLGRQLSVFGTGQLGRYFSNVMGYPVAITVDPDLLGLDGEDKVAQMGAFPAKDSVSMVGDVLVVKLSDEK